MREKQVFDPKEAIKGKEKQTDKENNADLDVVGSPMKGSSLAVQNAI